MRPLVETSKERADNALEELRGLLAGPAERREPFAARLEKRVLKKSRAPLQPYKVKRLEGLGEKLAAPLQKT